VDRISSALARGGAHPRESPAPALADVPAADRSIESIVQVHVNVGSAKACAAGAPIVADLADIPAGSAFVMITSETNDLGVCHCSNMHAGM
jgi:hypothetical protein